MLPSNQTSLSLLHSALLRPTLCLILGWCFEWKTVSEGMPGETRTTMESKLQVWTETGHLGFCRHLDTSKRQTLVNNLKTMFIFFSK